MKIIMLVGSNPNHRALACKIHEEFNITGLVVELRKGKKKTFWKKILHYWDMLSFYKINYAWFSLMRCYNKYFPEWPSVDFLTVENINDNNVIKFVNQLKPDLILVSGTRILKKDFLSAVKPTIGILNLHTGISPYVKGGPNCTNWCLARDTFHLIGNTIMWIDEGIDTGNLIATERTQFNGDESLEMIHLKVMEHAHDLYIRTVEKMKVHPDLCENVPQSEIAEGELYLSKMWNKKMKKALLHNIENHRFERVVKSLHYQEKVKEVKLVDL